MKQRIDETKEQYGIPKEFLEKIIAAIKTNNNIKEIILFGSRAKGNFKTGSDVDIALVSNDISYDEISHIRTNIDELLLPYNVDIIDYNKITNNALKEHILKVGQVIHTVNSK
jgi:predicted nucleotidyltransferase